MNTHTRTTTSPRQKSRTHLKKITPLNLSLPLFSSFRLKSYPNLAENIDTKGTNRGAETPPKQSTPDESTRGIADRAMLKNPIRIGP
jgi:hypothetical protein